MLHVDTYESTRELHVLSSMVWNTEVLNRLSATWQGEAFLSRIANKIANWCVSYFLKYNRPPGSDLEKIMVAKSLRSLNKEETHQTEMLVRTILERSEDAESNPGSMVDIAEKLFYRNRADRLKEQLEQLLATDDVEGIKDAVAEFHRVQESTQSDDYDMASSLEVGNVFDSCENDSEEMVRFKGAAGDFFNQEMIRGAFVAFIAPEKTGKSFMLCEMVYQAICNRKKVVYFQVGDMTRKQIGKRMFTRIASHPIRSPGNHWPYRVQIPEKISRAPKSPSPTVSFRVKTFEAPLSRQDALEALDDLQKNRIRSVETHLRTIVRPAGTVTVDMIRSRLNLWESMGWVADVVVIDYADILAAPRGHWYNNRDPINANWTALRALSSEKNCLVITATQADAASYDARVITKKNFNNDKRILSHVTAMFGINMSSEEKQLQQARINTVISREGSFSDHQFLYVANCLPLANPIVRSCL